MLTPLVLSLLLAGKQDQGLLHNTFDRGTEGWSTMQVSGSGSKVEAIYDKEHLKSSPGSLKYSYKVNSGELSVAALVVDSGKLAKMNSLHFWIQSDHQTSVVVTLQEQDGGRYSAACHIGKNTWQEVNLALSDFVLGTEADAPKDPDGKLDPDQVTSVALVDLEQFLAQNQGISDALGVTTGARNLYVSDVKFLETKLPETFIQSADSYQVDNFNRPQVSWMGIGMGSMGIASESPFPGKWLKLDYHVSAAHANGTIRAIPPHVLVGKKNLILQLGATRSCQLLIQFEQTNGAKFEAMVDLPGKAESKTLVVPISSMTISADSPDKEATLDLNKVKQVLILDTAGFLGGTEGDNTLWVGPVTAKA